MPWPTRLIVGTAAGVFAYGTGAHVVQLLVGGLNPYPAMPRWLAIYFVSLTVLDALAVVLLWRRPVLGLVLGCVILATDAAANGYANYVVDDSPGVTAGRIGQALITLLALALVALTPRTVRALRHL
ncbi:hypothetical protein [Paractinoplanes bogorensis]|uniref:hypothetical protein n=1 Tax=Paractinoplanes bogorensis TaxID=1610840 RepID=UPI001FEC9243|nr:hypothetical protein [Actinoplanes bogorensis]